MGIASRRKGSRVERLVAAALREQGLPAERVPLSGGAGGRFSGDIAVDFLGKERRVEVKARANGFKQIYAWLADHDYLVLKADNKEMLIVLRLDEAARIAALAEKAGG